MFWDSLSKHTSHTAVIDEGGKAISYSELSDRVSVAAEHMCSLGTRQLGLLFISNTLSSLVAYLACLRARHVPLLLPVGMAPELVANLKKHYLPDWTLGEQIQGATLMGSGLSITRLHPCESRAALAPELALLLSTSGSTGSPKLVRLSYDNLQANATSITQYLALTSDERALTLLPSHYSYGLSIINSHLHAGASMVMSEVSVLSPAFTEIIHAQAVTSLAGVPYTYQMLWRTGFNKKDFPSLRTLTQAGGRLDDKLTRAFAQLADKRGWRFFTMYGQTEATARISYVPPHRLAEKIGSIGIAIPGGQLRIDSANDELIYTGPNVMLGYATSCEDLARSDDQRGLLRTGDIGRQDEEGFFYITGRLKRFVKLAGNRIGLDELEQQLQDKLRLSVMTSGRDERLVVWLETVDETLIETAKQWLSSQFGIHHSFCRFRLVESLPILSNGKKDYPALLADL
jgi:long-chain acyl-CoA synthetase